MHIQPYIGITDFTAFWQVKAMLEVFKAHLPKGSKRKLHVGVMMSYKTLHGIPTKWQNAFPPKEAIAGIFSSDKVYNCLHYADYSVADPDLPRSLSLALECCGIGIRAIQLDMVWPDPGQVWDGVDRSRKHLEIILQVGRRALEEVRNDPQLLAARLHDYEDVVHRVLLDKSGGEGRGMDAASLLPFVRAIKENSPGFGLVVAGGLGPETMHLVEPIVKEFPDVSIDAQGKLRPSGNALDPIDWHMAGAYLIEALKLLK
ncbi:hypothetical protein KGQ72_00720 [Patescibacteria group bacterium]|nr:hypothetical protein [Patescibacteria group bacterium]